MRLRLVVCIVLVAVAVWGPRSLRAQEGSPIQVELKPTPLANANGLGKATGSATLDAASGWVTLTMKLPDGYKIPEKTVFEGWLVDAGAIASPANNAATADERFGPRYGNRTVAALENAIGYWLTAGQLVDDGKGNLTAAMKWPNYNLAPYDTVFITIETDGNVAPWDPRPGSNILQGAISDGKPGEAVDVDKLLGPMPDLSTGQGISLRLTRLGEAAGLKGATGKAFILTEAAAAEIDVKLPAGAKLPDGAVLEAWVTDAGRLTPFGKTHVHNADNKLGPSLNNAYLGAIMDAIPFSTSLGVLKADSSGTYTLQVQWQKYAFRVYDIVSVTLEADGDTGKWNPRPGTPVLVGPITPDVDMPSLLAMPGDEDMAPPSEAGRVTAPPPTAAATQAAK
jgi:hypothetical protein